MSLNIDYGLTPPADTSKLWVPLGGKPESVEVSGDSLVNAVEAVGTKGATLTSASAPWPAAAVNGKIYQFRDRAACLVYDPETDTISSGTTFADFVQGSSSCEINGKIYLFGTSTASTYDRKSIVEYDPDTDTYTTKGLLSNPGMYSSAAAINGKAYIFGGEYQGTSAVYHYNTIHEYDPSTNTVTTMTATLASTLSHAAATVVNGKVYIFGGRVEYAISSTSNTISEYDPQADILTVKEATLPVPMYGARAECLNGKVYIMGGGKYVTGAASAIAGDTIYEYDPATDTITTKDATLPYATYMMGSAVVGDTIYLLGGNNSSLFPVIQFYTPKAYLTTNRLKLFASVYENETARVVTNIVNGENEQIKLYMTSAFLGDSEGYAEAVDAYVYNTTNEEWQKLDGTSYVSTLAAEVQSLTADLGAAVETIYQNDMEVIENV